MCKKIRLNVYVISFIEIYIRKKHDEIIEEILFKAM